MRTSFVRRLRDQIRPAPPRSRPPSYDDAAVRLLQGRHRFAYRWVLPYVAGRRVLDIGPNRGYGLQIMRPYVRSLVAVDLSMDMVRASRNAADVLVARADGQALPFGDGTFDAVVSFQVVEHVWDDAAFLVEVRRVLAPNGLAILSTPQRRYRLLYRQMPWNEEHLREFDERRLRDACETAFGDVVTIAGVFGDAQAEIVERARVAPDTWSHFLPGTVFAPLRFLARRIQRALGHEFHLPTESDLSRLAAADPLDLVGQYYVASDNLGAALDLIAISGLGAHSPGMPRAFDAGSYWSLRHAQSGGLESTGTLGGPAPWQRWLYRGKSRAYLSLVRRNGVTVSGRRILDFGCGRGYFEALWARLGAAHLVGMELDPALVRELRAAHPKNTYLCGDLAEEPDLLRAQGPFDLVALIDVAYHLIDDNALDRVLRGLTGALTPGGWILLTDSLHDARPARHVRFRSLNHWIQLLQRCSVHVVDREPVFAVHNHLGHLTRLLPGFTGFLQYIADAPVRRLLPWAANNWAVLGKKQG